MLKQLQLIYDRVAETAHEKKTLEAMIKDALTNSKPYGQARDRLLTAQIELKQARDAVFSDFQGDIDKLDTMRLEIKTDKELMTDAALSDYIKGQTVVVKDKDGNEYMPVWSVKFKRVKEAKTSRRHKKNK